ncbi:MAG: hypothetical protein ISEC1_P0524 [Thiomicrorhabdus sp.]|nr:MAG: hypothetical protein ISEC1_P0524 [Thiomicrorhabdus sp.]
MVSDVTEQAYAGFWVRVGASLIDTVLLLLIIIPTLLVVYGEGYLDAAGEMQGTWDVFFNYVFPVTVVMTFWIYKSATPGKMILKLSIVDTKTGGKPSTGQFFIRYLGYIPSTVIFLLGFIWIVFDNKKRGLHDIIAGTVVIQGK